DVYCSTDAPVLLNPLTSEGDFTGPVLSDVFDPNIAPGIYDITYTTGSGVCSASITQTVEVLASESSDFYIFPAFCASSPVDQMIPEVPGGVFTGTGVSGDVFDPATALLGDNDITYTLTQANGCISVTTQTVEVFAVANSDFTGLEPISCTTAGLVELVPVSLGGIFSGPGVSGSVFDPVAAGVGQHTILYDINLGDCQSETQVTTLVVEGPVADITVAGDLMSASAAQQGATYQWWNCDNQMPVEGATSAEFTITDPSQNGTYAVAVTLNGCEAMSECVLLLIESVDEVQQDWSAGIFPNPANTMLTVWSSRPATCAIYNSVGSRVSSFAIAATQRAIEVGELPSGLYHVVLDDGTSLRNHTLLIEH
ncbi:MAG: T9SS type A sorting domain-containing protein, partial [Flavobacteriales bacterium]